MVKMSLFRTTIFDNTINGVSKKQNLSLTVETNLLKPQTTNSKLLK